MTQRLSMTKPSDSKPSTRRTEPFTIAWCRLSVEPLRFPSRAPEISRTLPSTAMRKWHLPARGLQILKLHVAVDCGSLRCDQRSALRRAEHRFLHLQLPVDARTGEADGALHRGPTIKQEARPQLGIGQSGAVRPGARSGQPPWIEMDAGPGHDPPVNLTARQKAPFNTRGSTAGSQSPNLAAGDHVC